MSSYYAVLHRHATKREPVLFCFETQDARNLFCDRRADADPIFRLDARCIKNAITVGCYHGHSDPMVDRRRRDISASNAQFEHEYGDIKGIKLDPVRLI